MRKMNKFAAVGLALVLSLSLFATPINASTSGTKTRSKESYFNNEWEKTTSYNVNGTKVGYLIWGYDTDWIKEDYAWSVGFECGTKPAIKRNYYDHDYNSGTWGQAYIYGKQEVMHQTYNVYYRITFDATYSNLSEGSTSNSSVK